MRYIESYFTRLALYEGGLMSAIAGSGLGSTVLTTFSILIWVAVLMTAVLAAKHTIDGV